MQKCIFKIEKFPNKNLWTWTGFSFDKELKDKEDFMEKTRKIIETI